MTRKRCAGMLLTAVLAWAGPSPAQEATAGTKQSDIQVCGPSQAIQVVAGFLSLSSDQVPALQLLLRARQQAEAPLFQGIAERERRIQELLDSGGDPVEIGTLVVEIHRLRQGAVQVQADFLARLGGLLSPDQQQRWAAVQIAQHLQPILPAFLLLRLL